MVSTGCRNQESAPTPAWRLGAHNETTSCASLSSLAACQDSGAQRHRRGLLVPPSPVTLESDAHDPPVGSRRVESSCSFVGDRSPVPSSAAILGGAVARVPADATTFAFQAERTQAGLDAARARGRLGGRPKALDERKAQIARELYANKANSIADICRTLRVSRATLYRYLTTKT